MLLLRTWQLGNLEHVFDRFRSERGIFAFVADGDGVCDFDARQSPSKELPKKGAYNDCIPSVLVVGKIYDGWRTSNPSYDRRCFLVWCGLICIVNCVFRQDLIQSGVRASYADMIVVDRVSRHGLVWREVLVHEGTGDVPVTY